MSVDCMWYQRWMEVTSVMSKMNSVSIEWVGFSGWCMDLMILRWHWWHLHSHYWANQLWICFKSNGHSTGWILTGLVPIRISVLITSWITPILTLRHRIVQEMMEDQVMISICMVMKGMRNGYEAVLLHPFPTSLFWLYLMDHRAHATHLSSPCHSVPSLLQPATDPILITDRFS